MTNYQSGLTNIQIPKETQKNSNEGSNNDFRTTQNWAENITPKDISFKIQEYDAPYPENLA